jgi:hypothetical protein
MEGFVYTDMFSTKGIEYLLVILYLLVIIGFSRYLAGKR